MTEVEWLASAVFSEVMRFVLDNNHLSYERLLLLDEAVGVEQPYAEYMDVIRCVSGNPFRPIAADPAWLAPTAVALAQGIYADRAFDRMPILAGALQDAGCANDDVLNHCRGGGPHVRGCWVVDLLTGRA